jgi:ribosomal protein S18 acetylase RimI-like enzyme
LTQPQAAATFAGIEAPVGSWRVTLRASTPADDDFLTRVFASTRAAELAQLASAPELLATFVASQSSLQRRAYAARYPSATFMIVELDGIPAGRLFVARGETELRLVDIALLDGFRGAGIGERLVRGVLTQAAAERLEVRLEVDLANPALRLYERLGFVAEAATEIQASLRWSPPPAGTQVKAAS